MSRSREKSWCCGAGAGVKTAYPDFALWIGQERVKEAAETGAEALVTACPFCEGNLNDISDLVMMALEQ
jgi:Fe-S oxidoreductase